MSSYPLQPLDTYEDLYGALGSFWRREFVDKAELKSLMGALSERMKQFMQSYLENVNILSVAACPVYHKKRWYKLDVFESEMNTSAASNLKYGADAAVYGNQTNDSYGNAGQVFVYGGPGASGDRYTFSIPNNLIRCLYFASNSIRNPDVMLFNGLDFEIDSDIHGVIFYENPFSNDAFEKRPVYDDDGNHVDDEITFWFFGSEWDEKYLYKHYGIAVGIEAASSDYYRTILKSYWYMLLGGATPEYLMMYLSGVLGVPVAADDETVTRIASYDDKIQIITDKNVYTAPSTAASVVSVDDVLAYGDRLFDSFDLRELSGHTYDISDIPRLGFGDEFLSGGYTSELVFDNKVVTLDWGGYDADGKAVVTFEISGYQDDIDLFWANAIENGKQSGYQTLAEMLDERTNKVGQPNESNLPDSVNPLEYVVENILRNNVFMVRIDLDDQASGAPGLRFVRFLKAVIPPHTTFIAVVSKSTDSQDAISIGGTTGVNISDGPTEVFNGGALEDGLDMEIEDD